MEGVEPSYAVAHTDAECPDLARKVETDPSREPVRPSGENDLVEVLGVSASSMAASGSCEPIIAGTG